RWRRSPGAVVGRLGALLRRCSTGAFGHRTGDDLPREEAVEGQHDDDEHAPWEDHGAEAELLERVPPPLRARDGVEDEPTEESDEQQREDPNAEDPGSAEV